MRKALFFIISVSILISCGKALTKFHVKGHNKIFRFYHYTNGKKELLFVPMIHVNTPEKFKAIKFKVDSLRADGYVLFYEDLSVNKPVDSQLMITFKKFRNVCGNFPADYFDKRNKQFKNLAVKGFVLQTHENTGIDVKRDVRADLPMDTLIALYEREKGEIILSDCDLKTPLLEVYKCKKTNKKDSDFMIETLRDRFLSYKIVNSNAKKIAVVYGSRHSVYLEDGLKAHDTSWHYVQTPFRKAF